MIESPFHVPQPQLTAYRRSSLLFGLSGGLLFLAVLALFVAQQGWFQRQFYVRVVAPTSLGLAVGTPVRLSGLRVGVLERIQLLPDGRVTLSLRIPDRYRAWISPRSTARISTDSLLSQSAVDLTAAPTNPAQVPQEFQVAYSRASGLEELIRGAEATRKELNGLLRSTQRIADKELPAALKGIEGVMASSNALAGTINREVPPTTAELRATLRTFDQTGRAATRTSDAVERTLVDLRPDLKTALQEMAQLMARSNALLKGLQGLLEPARSSPTGPAQPPAPVP
ncbi:MAG: MlaD family protein [Cyanobacteriota bacterium]|nr:MlaD family protein [Cyanobacteriota bacterium]